MPEPLFFEDFVVGQTFRSAERNVRPEEIKAFAREYDPQPFHLNEQAAASSLFGGLAASGWHTAAMTMRLLVNGGLPIAGGIIGLGGELSWPAAVRPGDVLHTEAEVTAVRGSASRPESGLVTFRITTRQQDGKAVQVFTPTVIVPRRPA